MPYVGPHEIAARIRQEFPDAEITLTNINGLEAEFSGVAEKPKLVRARIAELSHKAQLFNAHMDLGHRTRRTNWWK